MTSVCFKPLNIPAKVACNPSKTWKKHSVYIIGTQTEISAMSFVNKLVIIPGAIATMIAEDAMKIVDNVRAVYAYFLSLSNSFAPFEKPTLTPAAFPIAKGTINAIDVIVHIIF